MRCFSAWDARGVSARVGQPARVGSDAVCFLSMNTAHFATALLALSLPVLSSAAPAKGDGKLHIAAIDVEGGQATLFVSPTGQSLLVDAGWPGNNYRDADRIVAAAKDFGLSSIDTVLITHYHTDHAGGVPQLVERIPVSTFIDHGDRDPRDAESTSDYDGYKKVLASGKYKRVSVKAGDKLPLEGFDGTVIAAAGRVLAKPLPGAGAANPLCDKAPAVLTDTEENGQSLAFVLRFAGLTIVDGGDLTLDRERMLVCPVNKVGQVDLMIVSHHGVDWSSSPVWINSLAPRVAEMDNGSNKGGSTSVIDTIKASPRLQALYQLHLAPPTSYRNPGQTQQGGAEHNTAAEFIANGAGVVGKRVDVTVNPDGSMDVLNQGTGQTKHFAKP